MMVIGIVDFDLLCVHFFCLSKKNEPKKRRLLRGVFQAYLSNA